ncbi:hypothetical protein WR25_11902 [Diploscapter pachys]|uniref:Cyclin N-terminal domain-containing protein n=1 Tax=Diploscapter pachys TaxID=2018661 RepID=A0A2A2J9D7_9BILA|nr:hypothetical protein WR25_11902 [Diploscapter pachys]
MFYNKIQDFIFFKSYIANIYSLRNRRVHKSTVAVEGTRNLNGNEHGQGQAEMKAAALRRTALAQINNNIHKPRATSRIITKSIIDDEPIQQARCDVEAAQMTISNEPSTEPAPVPAPTKDKDNCPFNLPSKFALLSVTGNRAQPAELWDYVEYAEDVLDYLVQYEKEQRFGIPADLLTSRRAPIKSKTYVILVDYIAQLHAEFRQASVIFDLSVYLLNRAILEFKHIDKQSYQIITITCL